MNYGIKVSKPGYDVKTASDESLVLTSELNLLKIKNIIEFTITLGTPPDDKTINIAHNLGYKPKFIVYMANRPGREEELTATFYRNNICCQAYAYDNNIIKVRLYSYNDEQGAGEEGSAGTYKGHCWIFIENLA